MGKKTRTKLEEKKQKSEEFNLSLKKRRLKKWEKEERKKKKKDSDHWLKKVPYLADYAINPVRPIDQWKSPSYNEERQIISLVHWVLCVYEVPKFLFNIFLPYFTHHSYWDYPSHRDMFFNWFLAIARGKSFRKLTKDIFTKKEAHAFLTGKHEKIGHNIWHAKVSTRNFKDKSMEHLLIRRFFEMRTNFTRPYWSKVIDFYKKFEENLNYEILGETLDFLFFRPGDLDLKGRTLASLIRLSNEWHLEQSRIRGVKHLVRWEPLPIEDWIYEDKEGTTTTIKQLNSNIQLVKEGNKQHNCVSAYAIRCQRGDIGIFSMKSGPTGNRITIEVTNTGQIIQAKLPWNRIPKGVDEDLIYKWAFDNVLTVIRF